MIAEDKVYDVIYQSTDSRILAMLGSNMVEGVLSGNPVNSSVSGNWRCGEKDGYCKNGITEIDVEIPSSLKQGGSVSEPNEN